MSSRLPLGWSKILEGLPKVELALEGGIKTKEFQVETATLSRNKAATGKSKILRIDAPRSGHLQPKFLTQIPAVSSVELS
ncbi:MAG: hypothetical protein RLY14_1062, partial [Planctomycetota bacterium]